MPPATTVSLRELADLSIGTPEVGAVNFTALHTLIVAMLKNLDLQNTRIDFQAPSPEPSHSLLSARSSLNTPHLPAPKEAPKGAPREKRRGVGRVPPSALESQVKDLGGQVEDLSKQLKRVDSQMQGIATHVQRFSQASGLDLASQEWPEEQEVAMQVLDRVRTGSILKDAAEELSFARVILQRVDELEKLLKDREQFLELVSRKLSLVPGAEEVTMVTWEELEQAITDGWRASQAGSETLMGFSKRRGFTSLTSPDGTLSGASTKQPSIDQVLDSAGGLGPDQTASGSGGATHPSEGVISREQSRGPSGTGRQQQPRARDEAGMPRLHQSSVLQFKPDSDRRRSREKLTSTLPRRDERDARPGPVQQDLTSAREQPSRVPASQSQVHLRSDRRGLEPTGMDQPGLVHAGTYLHGVVPLSMGQLRVPPPEMDDQEWGRLVMDEQRMLPPSVPGRDQQGLELPSTDQHGLVSVGAYQHGMVLPGIDQRSMEPLGMDQRGFIISGMGQQGLVAPGVDQQGLILPVIDQHGLILPFTDQHGLVSPGLMPISADQQGFVQPSLEATGFIQPGTEQHDLIQSGRFQHAVVQPGAYQPGLVQPGADQRGLVRPGMDQSGLAQPGRDQHRLIQPGTGQHDLVQSGTGQGGLPGMDQSGLAQPGRDQHGLVQSGTGQGGLVQPGVDQPGMIQPGADQHGLVQIGRGLVQPGEVQHGLVQPGADQRGLVQPGADQRGLVQPGVDQRGLVQPSEVQRGLVQPGAVQYTLMQPGAVQRSLVQPGAVQRGLVQPGVDQRGLVQPGVDQRGLVPPGAVQRGLVQPGVDQRGLVPPGAVQRGLVQPGVDQRGLVQPGVDQRGLVQPGVDQRGLVQPGAGQPGLVQPGAGQLGMVQPGIDQQGLVQPQADPRGLVQPGAYPLGFVQPGVYLHDLSQPGTYPHGLVQPGMERYGLRQSGTYQPGLTAPGTKLRGSSTFQADSTGFVSARPYQHGMVPPGREQYGQMSPLLASQGLASPGINQRSLVPPETYQQGLMHPGTDQHGPIPLSTGLGSTHPDQQHLASLDPGKHEQVHPDAAQHGCAFSLSLSPDSMCPGYGGPGYLSADQHGQEGLDPNRTRASDQPGIPAQKAPGQDVTLFRSPDSLHRVSSERSEVSSEVLSERHDSLYRMSSSFPTAVETFRLLGELSGLYMGLKESMKDLDEEQAGQTDMEKIQFLLAQMVKRTVPSELQEQLKTVKTLAKEVRQEKVKVERLQRILEGEGTQEAGKELKAGELRLQLGVLRVTVADIEKELAELRESQDRGKAAMENSVSEASLYLQDQLDKLRMIIESMLTSSSTLLSMSMAPHKAHTLAPGQIDPEATCPACSLDVGHQVSMLVQRYEQLQDMVNSLVISRPSKKAKLQRQDEELLGRVQSAILQVQGDCEKLNITTSNLIEDHRQKQKDIAMLYQGLEKLEKEKANREHLEMEIDVKADKSALATKVSRIQFDATTEQLNHMMQELVAKMSGQEQDWQKMLDKLLTEMDNKLDRLELDPVKQLLEDRWKSLRQQLRERPPLYQADEAAAMRRQLLAHFHCLSCDRPLETPVTGHAIPVTPAGPGLPGHHSIRPYTVFELEQVRQHSRNLKLGSAFPRGDLAQMKQSVGRLRSMHSKMLMNIEKVQIHFGGSTKASSQIIRELLHSQCLGSPCYKRVTDMADYTYSTVPRRCGGSHTLTYPYHRSRPQHLPRGVYPTEEIQIAMKRDEVDILGLDGHIYKGRMDTRLPGILSKDSSGTSKRKSQQPRPHVHRPPSLGGNGHLPSRPQSAQMSRGGPGSGRRCRKEKAGCGKEDPE
uniref:Glutamine rich 2 n=1 Tax=Cercocebus atys TaxID=9531 RepID=A0A2K5LYK2_CERAT